MVARRAIADTAETHLTRKLRLEKQLKTRLRVLNREFLKASEAHLARTGMLLPTANLQAATETILREHTSKVGRQFSKRMRRRLPSHLRITAAENVSIESALSDFYAKTAGEQAARIVETTAKNMRRALQIVESEAAAAGEALTGAERARRAKGLLRRNLDWRTDAIATTETQAAAEAAKLTEVEVLAGREPTVRSGPADTPAPFSKRWDSLGDSVARDSHLAADSQVINANDPFIVGGFQLMWPGDSSLGAPLRETANCRCSAHFEEIEIIAIREEMQLAA